MKILKKFDLISLILITLFIHIIVISYIFIDGSQEKAGMLKIFLASVTFMVILIFLIRTFILKKILRPLGEISRISSLIAESSLGNKVEVSSSDELEELTTSLSKIAGSLDEKMERLETSISKEQRVVRELAILSEMVGAIVSERNFETMLDTFLERTRSLLKSEYSGIFIFEGENKELKMFRTTFAKDVSLDCARAMADGPFKNVLETFIPLRVNMPLENTPSDHPEIKNMIALPLAIAGDKLSGLLILINKEGGFREEDEDTLFNFSFHAFQILTVHNELTRLATTDSLTGLNNHRVFQERLNEEISRTERYSKVLSLIMFDIDHFKSFNDTYGHQTGDKVLKEIGGIINNSIRNVDFPARYGGEEFVIIVPETGCDEAVIIAERIRRRVLEHPFTTETGERVMMTISAGIACYPSDATLKEDFIRKTDQALYFAKNHGRNRVCTYQETIIGALKEIPAELEDILKDPDLKGIETVAKGIDAKSHYTKGHSLEVAAYAVMLGNHINLAQKEIESLKIASILHDLGNVGIPDRILNKPGALTPEEKRIIQGHPGLAEMVLKKHPHIEDIMPTILYHHERFDGKGYPLGLKGEEIPLLARILSIAEAYQAMVSSRPYRRRLSKNEAIEELKKEAGAQFDPIIVDAFINLLQQEKDGPSE